MGNQSGASSSLPSAIPKPRIGDGCERSTLREMRVEPPTCEFRRLRPPAPLPRAAPLGPVALLKALWRNPLKRTDAFRAPVVSTKLPIGQITVVSEPQAVRRVLPENAANYRKDGSNGG